jgi:hypothetical protein
MINVLHEAIGSVLTDSSDTYITVTMFTSCLAAFLLLNYVIRPEHLYVTDISHAA